MKNAFLSSFSFAALSTSFAFSFTFFIFYFIERAIGQLNPNTRKSNCGGKGITRGNVQRIPQTLSQLSTKLSHTHKKKDLIIHCE
jgi:hypothetical protein